MPTNPLLVVFGILVAFSLGYVICVALLGLYSNPTPLRIQERFSRSWGLQVVGEGTSDGKAQQVRWKLFGEDLMSDEDLRNVHQTSPKYLPVLKRVSSRQSADLLESIPWEFQQLLHTGTPLSCHTGERELISRKYERFLKTLFDYVSFHKKTGETKGNTRTLVWQCTQLEYCGGLVDRLKGITYALLLAMFSRRRLILYWGGPEHVFLQPNMIDWTNDTLYDYLGQYDVFKDYDNEEEEDVLVFEKKQPTWKGTDEYDGDGGDEYIHNSVAAVRMFSILGDFGIDISEEDLRYNLELIGSRVETVTLSTNLEPSTLLSARKTAHQKWIKDGLRWNGLISLSHTDFSNVVGIAFRYLFRIKQELLMEVANARSVLGLDGALYTGVHIRTGFAGSNDSHEMIKHPKLIREEDDWEAILKCAISTADTFLGYGSLLFLATDSVLVKHMAVSEYGARIRTLDNSLVHLDKMAKIPYSYKNHTEGILTSWVDFLLLAEAFAHVRGSSGFPWAAGTLCSLPNEKLINGTLCAPEKLN